MKVKPILVLVLSFLILSVPVAPIDASAAAGKMTTKGSAEINGVAAPAVTSVFVGDRIATQRETTTSLSFAGGDAIVLPELTKAALGQRDGRFVVNLVDGTVSVLNKTQTPILIEIRGARIQAASGQPSLYDVTVHGNALRVVARSGAARVETANRIGTIESGNALTATLAPIPSQPGNQLFGVSTWVVATVAVGAATGLGVGLWEALKSSSPSQ
ncbi:MAG TPA: hypothetical protein VJO53_08260 [Candidatus Acidoferrales bacterium]|nr:hypothetical protein [Candidatus Acidoferrales bacterium]